MLNQKTRILAVSFFGLGLCSLAFQNCGHPLALESLQVASSSLPTPTPDPIPTPTPTPTVTPTPTPGPVTAQCGSANLQSNLTQAPAPGSLCALGTPSKLRGNGPWTWECDGASPTDAPDICVATPGSAVLVQHMTSPNLLAIKNQIAAAKQTFVTSPSATIVMKFPPGVFDFSQDASVSGPSVYCQPNQTCVSTNSLDLSGVITTPSKGRLVIAGSGINQTEFIFNPDQVPFYGTGIQGVTVMGLKVSQDRLGASQGHVVTVANYPASAGWVVFDVPAGFPDLQLYPTGLLNLIDHSGNGRYFRRYSFSPDHLLCQIDITLPQQSFDPTTVTQISTLPNRWAVRLSILGNKSTPPPSPFSAGDLIGIKSNHGGGNAYFFLNTSDFVFDHVLWTRHSRGVFRAGSFNIGIFDSAILLDPPINGEPICMSSSAGGPQIGQPNDPPTWGNVVDNFYAQNTGDDSIAIFNSHDSTNTIGTTVSNSFITDSFARSINYYLSPLPSDPTPGPNLILNTVETDCNPGTSANFSECILDQYK